ncbi:MAG TPA: DUF3592 domain-containing protein [Ktedonobacteraceae bacterium]|nr:DUF3592 domain-containing protein [Ktedonobacteraceae bacterium]
MKKPHFKWVLLPCFLIIILAASGALLWFGGLLCWGPIGNFVTLQGYHQGQCTILSKDLSYYTSFNQDTGNNETQYGLDFTFFVHDASHNSARARGYGIDQHTSNQRGDAQAILDHYTVGQTYTCWYDPANASHAVLTRDITEWILLLPGGIMLVVGLGLLIGSMLFVKWAWRVTAPGSALRGTLRKIY